MRQCILVPIHRNVCIFYGSSILFLLENASFLQSQWANIDCHALAIHNKVWELRQWH